MTTQREDMAFPRRLVDGYRAFCGGRLSTEQDRYRALAEEGQAPDILVIGCSDSRVSPEVIFDARPGELFIVRNVANLVPPYNPDGRHRAVSAALEFAVNGLKVGHIVVLGHAHCGGISAFADPGAPLSSGDFIGKWMELIRPASNAVGPPEQFPDKRAYLTRLEQASVVGTLTNLRTFPWIAARVAEGRLRLHGAYFGVATGALLVFDPLSGAFRPLAADAHGRALAQPRF